nr:MULTISPECIES: sugar ABC transporter ATP-binding protein [Clostridia]
MDISMEKVVTFQNIKKEFSGVCVLEDVNLDIYAGEVLALVGENGAGKSTLMKILSGVYEPTSGKIFLSGKEVKFEKALDALDGGISMIHQELMPVMDMTVAENIFLGREPQKKVRGFVSRKKMYQESDLVSEEFGLTFSSQKKMKDLSIAQRQMVEIARGISRNARVIIMDEPTSALSDRESLMLFEQISKLKKKGIAIIFISHKMDEIFTIADRIAVLRDGKMVHAGKREEYTEDILISQMVGRELNTVFPPAKTVPGDVLLRVENLELKDTLMNISFEVRSGEIFGIAGLMGSGRSEIVESIFGLRKGACMTLYKKGKKIQIHNPGQAIKQGIAFVPEDRKVVGLNLSATVKENMSMAALKQNYSKRGFLHLRKESEECEKQIERMRIKTTGPAQKVKNLSGGNQQKIVIARWLITDCDIFFLDDPTRGIDVMAKAEIYALIRELAAMGKAIVLISSEMPEIIGLCDRAMVMCEGRKTGELGKNELEQEAIMKLASGL